MNNGLNKWHKNKKLEKIDINKKIKNVYIQMPKDVHKKEISKN